MFTLQRLFVFFIFVLISSASGATLVDQVNEFATSLSNAANEIKTQIMSSTATAQEMLTKYPAEAWESLKEKDYASMGTQRLNDLLSQGRSKLSQRVQAIIQNAKYDLLPPEEVSNELGKITSLVVTQKLCEKLPPASSWTKDTISRQWNSLKKCPSTLLLQVADKEALTTIKNSIGADRSMRAMQVQISLKIYGKPSTWTNETIQALVLDEYLLPYACMDAPANVLVSKLNEVVNVVLRVDAETRRICLNKLLEVFKLKDLTDITTVQKTVEQLRGLRADLMPGDFNPQMLENSFVKDLITNNIRTASTTGYIMPDGAKSMMEKFAKMTNITQITLREQGVGSIAWALPSDLMEAIMNNAFTMGDITAIMRCVKSFDGPGADDKKRMLATMIRNQTQNLNEITLSTYDESILSHFDFREWKKVSPSEARNILSKPCNMSAASTVMLIERMLSPNDLRSTNAVAMELIPPEKIDYLSANDLILMSRNHLPGSVLTMKAAEKYMQNIRSAMIEPTDVRNMLQVLPFIRMADAQRFNTAKILACLKEMKDVNPSFQAIMVFKDKFLNYTGNISTEYKNNPLSFLAGTDIDDLPVCFIASFGPQLPTLTVPEKKTLLIRLGQLKYIGLSCPRPNRIAIVTEGLRALRPSVGIQPGEVEIIGYAIFDVPARELDGAHENVKIDILIKMNDLILERRVLPCLNTDQRNAIAKLIKNVKGNDVKMWKSIKSVCCLLYTMNENDVKNIPPEVLASCSCEIREPTTTEMAEEAMCKGSLGEAGYKAVMEANTQFKRAQMMAVGKIVESVRMNLGSTMYVNITMNNNTMNNTNTTAAKQRKKRQSTTTTNTETCDKASYGGADAFTEAELNGMDMSVVLHCMEQFGSKNMEQRKAEILARKIQDARSSNLQNLSPEEMERMKYITKGLMRRDIEQSLPDFYEPKFDNVVNMFGQISDVFAEDQVQALAGRVKQHWARNIASLNSTHLLMLNHLLCGFSLSSLNSITVEAFKASITVLSKLKNCPRDPALIGLFQKAKQAYGLLTNWNGTDVAKMGVIFAGIMPEDWVNIKPEAMEGLSHAAVEKFSDGSISAMNSSHVKYMSPAAVAAFTDEQKAYFSPEMSMALKEYKSYEYESSADGAFVSLLLVTVLTLFTTLGF